MMDVRSDEQLLSCNDVDDVDDALFGNELNVTLASDWDPLNINASLAIRFDDTDSYESHIYPCTQFSLIKRAETL